MASSQLPQVYRQLDTSTSSGRGESRSTRRPSTAAARPHRQRSEQTYRQPTEAHRHRIEQTRRQSTDTRTRRAATASLRRQSVDDEEEEVILYPDGLNADYYVHTIYTERIATQNALTNENRALALKAITDVLKICMAKEPLYQKYFREMSGVRRERYRTLEETIKLETISPSEFDCKIVFKKPLVPGGFVSAVGQSAGLPSDRGTHRVNRDQLPQLVHAVSEEWGACLGPRSQISPLSVSKWFYKPLVQCLCVLREEAVRKRAERLEKADKQTQKQSDTQTTRRNHSVGANGATDDSRQQNGEQTETDEKTDEHNFDTWAAEATVVCNPPTVSFVIPTTEYGESEITVNIYPAIPCTGWPGSGRLRSPYPSHKPYSTEGHALLTKLHNKIEEHHVTWYLTGKRTPFEQLPLEVATSSWRVDLSPTTDMMYTELVESRPALHEAIEVLSLLLSYQDARITQALTLPVYQSLLMSVCRRSLHQLTGSGATLLHLLRSLVASLSQNTVHHFLLPQLNLLTSCSLDEQNQALTLTRKLQAWLKDEPRQMLRYMGCSYSSKFPKFKRVGLAIKAHYRIDHYNQK